jgi:hypothetical protein
LPTAAGHNPGPPSFGGQSLAWQQNFFGLGKHGPTPMHEALAADDPQQDPAGMQAPGPSGAHWSCPATQTAPLLPASPPPSVPFDAHE